MFGVLKVSVLMLGLAGGSAVLGSGVASAQTTPSVNAAALSCLPGTTGSSTPGSPIIATTSSPGTAAASVPPDPTPVAALAFTGTDVGASLALGSGLLGGGAILAVSSRRRRAR